ncbi:MAG TPA: hypothetical protein VER03_25140 [Bryobacteraceae bacterium]|nr:hypothetical protein [Bryobacteraceae bacterium]
MQEPVTKQDLYDTEARIGPILVQLAEVQMNAAEHLEKLTLRVDRLAEAQQHTEERLNTLITVVDDLVRRQRS